MTGGLGAGYLLVSASRLCGFLYLALVRDLVALVATVTVVRRARLPLLLAIATELAATTLSISSSLGSFVVSFGMRVIEFTSRGWRRGNIARQLVVSSGSTGQHLTK